MLRRRYSLLPEINKLHDNSIPLFAHNNSRHGADSRTGIYRNLIKSNDEQSQKRATHPEMAYSLYTIPVYISSDGRSGAQPTGDGYHFPNKFRFNYSKEGECGAKGSGPIINVDSPSHRIEASMMESAYTARWEWGQWKRCQAEVRFLFGVHLHGVHVFCVVLMNRTDAMQTRHQADIHTTYIPSNLCSVR